MHYSREGGKQAEGVEEHEGREPEEEEGRKKWKGRGWGGGVNRSLIQLIPSPDSCALLNNAFDTGCYQS